MIDEELLKGLKKANCTCINMGVEAGNEKLRAEILRRKMPNEQIIRAFDSAHKFGIKTLSYNMIGLPYETPEMIRETINLNKRLAPSNLAIFFFYPYPGTELYDWVSENNYFLKKPEEYLNDVSCLTDVPVFETPELPRRAESRSV